MEQSGKQLVILLTKEEVVAIDDFRFENRMRNRSDAARALLKLALDQILEKVDISEKCQLMGSPKGGSPTAKNGR